MSTIHPASFGERRKSMKNRVNVFTAKLKKFAKPLTTKPKIECGSKIPNMPRIKDESRLSNSKSHTRARRKQMCP